LTALSAGCAKEGLPGGHTCSYAGKTYGAGTSFPSTDGCNTCSCDTSGAVECTLVACLGDAGFSPPVDAAATADLAADGPLGSDVGVPGDDAAGDAASDIALTPDAATDTRSPADVATDPRPPTDAASEGKPPVDAANDKPSLDVGDAAKDAPSACLWQDASVPVGGSVYDGCNTCSCTSNGLMACTLRACPILDAGKDPCALPTAVAFGYDGGLVAYRDQYNLSPSTGLTVTRNYMRGLADGATVRTCVPKLPACGAPSVVSVSTIVADLAASDVQAAFALPATPIFGVDQRPMDGAVWSITLASGGTILVGAPCPSLVMNSCRPIPAGVQKLADDLKSLATAAAAQPACAGL
jgi:hypothetical protein